MPWSFNGLHGPGVGPGTRQALLEALGSLVPGWRERCEGITTVADELRKADESSKQAIRDGLDELEALFDLS